MSKQKKCNAETLLNQANLFADNADENQNNSAQPDNQQDDSTLIDFQEQRLTALRNYYIDHIDQFVERVKIGERETNIIYELANCNKSVRDDIISSIKTAITHLYLAKEKLIFAEKTRQHRKEYAYRKSIDFARRNLRSIDKPKFEQLLESEGDNRMKAFEKPKATHSYVKKGKQKNDKKS